MRRAAAALAAFAALAARAADPGWYLQVDNDAFFGTDRWYTSGVRVAYVQARGEPIAPTSGGPPAIEWGLLQEIYTPEAKRANPVDRPNAARLAASVARHDRTEGDWRTLELDVGVTGPAALGRQAQALVHRIVPAPREDWSHQRSDRLDVQLAWTRTQRISGAPWLNANYGAVLGSQVAFAHAGIELRFGHGAATSMASPALRFAATPPLAEGEEPSWSPFLGASVRAMAWNHLLDFAPGFAEEKLHMRRSVQRLAAGIAWKAHGMRAVLALLHDTREFDGQRRGAAFGSVTLHLDF